MARVGRLGGGRGGGAVDGETSDAEGFGEGDLAGVKRRHGPLAATQVDVRVYTGRPLRTFPAAHLPRRGPA